MIKRPVLVLALAITAAASGGAKGEAIEELKAQLDDALRTIRKLQERVDALERKQGTARAQGGAREPLAAAQPTPSVAAYVPPSTLKDNESAAQRVDNASIDPALKGFFRIPGTDTLMKFGGYAKVDFIYDTKPIGTFDYFVTSAIPTSGPDTQRGSQFTVQAKQTRLNVDLRRDTEAGQARMFFEADWFGNASSNFDAGSYQLRLRHAWGQLNNLAAGYSFSAFMDNDALPDTLDFEGPGASAYLLLAGARYTWKPAKGTTIAVSAEAPQSQITAAAGNGKSTAPDLTLRARHETDAGHVQLSGLWRRLGWDDGAGITGYTNGYGVNLAGSLKTVGDDYLVAGGVWGKGIARYVSDISGLGLDAVVDPGGQLRALEEYGGYAAYTHYWTPKLRSTAVVDYLGMSNQPSQPAMAFANSQYYSANVIWNPWGSLNVGIEVLYGRYRSFDGNSANDTRIQASAQYDLVR